MAVRKNGQFISVEPELQIKPALLLKLRDGDAEKIARAAQEEGLDRSRYIRRALGLGY